MSYCVNCGVELADSEKCCPLCGTEVINPREPWREPTQRPYPQRLELILKHIDRQYVATIIGLFALIPILVTLICDMLDGRGLSWSVYVLGAGALFYVWLLIPLYFKRYHRLTFLAADGLALILYLLLIDLMSGGHWFLPVGLPIAAAGTVLLLLLAFWFRRGAGRQLLVRLALSLTAAGVYCVLVELAVDLFAQDFFDISWSGFVLIPCLVLAAALLILEHRKQLKEEIKKRLFY
jgi:hypothetical protein